MRLLLLCLALLLPSLAAAQTFPPLTGRVVDNAGLLTPTQRTEIEQLSQSVEQASTRQFVIATVASLQGLAIEDYGYRLGRAWGIGQRGVNNGVILLIAPNEKKVRIEVGYGLEPIMTDALSSVIINQVILPKFRAGDMAGGIVAGAHAIADQLKLPLEAGEKRAAELARKQVKSKSSGDDFWVIVFWIVIFVVFVLPWFGGSRGRRYGAAPVVIWGPGGGGWGGGGGSSWSGGGGSGGGFSGGGGSFGGGGASGSW